MEIEQALEWVYMQIGKTAPISKSVDIGTGKVMKAVIQYDGTIRIEGFVSTNDPDIEGDILEPEAFSGKALTDYMQRGAPMSMEHQTKSLPVGYLTKSMLVRSGRPIQEEDNPKQEGSPFKYFNGGTGWYATGVIYDKEAVKHVVKGTLSSFSWIGLPQEWEVVGKGRKFSAPGSIHPLIETTVTAFPINTAATMRIVKARGQLPKVSLSDLAILMSTDEAVAEDIIGLLAPELKKSSRDAYNDVLQIASAHSEHRVKDYFSVRK